MFASPPNLIRSADFSEWPRVEIRNDSASSIDVTIETTIETVDSAGSPVVRTHKLAPRTSDTFPLTDRSERPEEIVLLRSTIKAGDLPIETVSAIVGSPRPVPRGADLFIGMNVHLQRFSPVERWQILRHMRDAGVRSVRLEPGFVAPDASGRYRMDPLIEECQLAIEAFGMNTLMALTFFPKPYYESADKNHMAYGWAKALGAHYKGRVFDYQYGNETNSGWAGFGAAADMAAHNQAMALGTLSADPAAIPSTLGIAEAQPWYLRELFRSGLSPYVRAVTVHPYCGTAEAGVAKLEGNQRVIREYGDGQELWATEIGFHFHEAGPLNPVTQQVTQVNGFSLKQQSDQLARLFILSRAKGIERIYWYNMYGKYDAETFWLLDENFKPQPAYHTFKYIAPWLNDAVPLGGTASTEPVQKQFFRRADGTLFLAAWAMRDGVEVSLRLPAGGAYAVTDIQGTADASAAAALKKAGSVLTLGETPILITGFPSDTDFSNYVNLSVLTNSLDSRNWVNPMSRFNINAGETIHIPWVVFNSGNLPVTASPVIVARMPGWDILLPEPVNVPAGETVTGKITLKAPVNVVPGVEYRFSFATETEGPRRTLPFESRVWVGGQFPYGPLLADDGKAPHYPMRRSIDEGEVGFGCAELLARRAPRDLSPSSIDGDLGKWSPEEFVTIDQGGLWILRDSQPGARERWHGRVALRWDDTHLYAAFIVLDDDISITDLTSRDWRDSDNVRLFLSAEADFKKRGTSVSPKELLLLMAPTRQFHSEGPAVMAASIGGHVRHNFESEVKIASRVWHGGYLIEAAIPFSGIGVTPRENLILGANVLADDAKDGFRINTYLTYLKTANYWNDPQTLGSLRLIRE